MDGKFKFIVNTGRMTDPVISKDKIDDIKNQENGAKPLGGLWGCNSEAPDYSTWKYWCMQNQPDWYSEKSFEVTLKEDARVLVVESLEDIEDILIKSETGNLRDARIDWEKAAKKYDIIDFRWDDFFELSYIIPNLDCDSCILLNKDVIEQIEEKKEVKDFTEALTVDGNTATINYDKIYKEATNYEFGYDIAKSKDLYLTLHVNEDGTNTPCDIYTGKGVTNLIIEGFGENLIYPQYMKIVGEFETLVVKDNYCIPYKLDDEGRDITFENANFKNLMMIDVPGSMVEITALASLNGHNPQIESITVKGERLDLDKFLKKFPGNINPQILNVNGENIKVPKKVAELQASEPEIDDR